MNEFAEILNLFIANVIAYTFFVAVYGCCGQAFL